MSTPKQKRSFGLGCYMDDSGSDENGLLAVLGGPVIPEALFTPFHLEWGRILSRHRIAGPIHMREFARPHGRLAYLSDPERTSLFSNLEWAITRHKLYSITAAVDHQDFREFFPISRFRGLFGPSPLAFLWCLILNACVVDDHKAMDRMSYVVSRADDSSQVRELHSFWCDSEQVLAMHSTGPISFDTPRDLYALQAADMVVWSNRRKQLGKPFDHGFQPLERLTRPVGGERRNFPHFHYVVKKHSTKGLADILNSSFPDPPKIGRIEFTKLIEELKPTTLFKSIRDE